MIPHRKTAPKINKEIDTEFSHQQQISEGGKNSEGDKYKVRQRTIYPKQETKKIIKENNNNLPVGRETQQINARDTRQKNRGLIIKGFLPISNATQAVESPQETPIDRAVRIAGTLTNAIKRMLKEPSIDAGRHENH